MRRLIVWRSSATRGAMDSIGSSGVYGSTL
jgi:hypothetical protein